LERKEYEFKILNIKRKNIDKYFEKHSNLAYYILQILDIFIRSARIFYPDEDKK